MHRSAPRRPRRVAALISLAALAACGDGEATDEPHVVAVAAQPCGSPNRALGWGVVVAEHLVATAAHTVEGPVREIRAGGEPATLVAVDARTDLALLMAPTLTAQPAQLSDGQVDQATVLTSDDELSVQVVSTGPLVVHDTTAGMRHERLVHRFTPAVAGGMSGAPLVDERNRVVGIVVLSEQSDDEAYAVTTGELATLIAERSERGLPGPAECPD